MPETSVVVETVAADAGNMSVHKTDQALTGLPVLRLIIFSFQFFPF